MKTPLWLSAGLWSIALLLLTASSSSLAEEAQWIWNTEHSQGQVPLQASSYFRRSFQSAAPRQGVVSLVANDSFELYVNGRRVGGGVSQGRLMSFNISRHLQRGQNTIAVRVVNTSDGDAGLAARVLVQEADEQWRAYSTNADWKASSTVFPLWNTKIYNDRGWSAAATFGVLGDDASKLTAAGDGQSQTPPGMHAQGRFLVQREFRVQRLLSHEQTGSLVAMAFNEFGHIIASRGDGPLLLIYDGNRDGRHDQVRVYCDRVTGCQGVLALNGDVYVTGHGPEGQGLYRLRDEDRNGELEAVTTLLRFEGPLSEHGAHGLTLGPDGFLYIVLGNHTRPLRTFADSSPYSDPIEGDLLQPRYEDPSGHAVDRKAPGGMVIRTDTAGRGVELIAGGLRNAYDLAFTRDGELFVHDSDMESDMGATWYRPTQLLHIVPGGEYGWRSGWAKFPDYYYDGLPAAAATGRGSPTGIVSYQHFAFPPRFQNALFLADWSQGRILVARATRQGASYTAETEVFMTGTPLNVCDMEVGPDGGLYFVTGGRDTQGGLYRVWWTGETPEELRRQGEGVSSAVKQPQLNSAWARQSVANLKQAVGENWTSQLESVALNPANSAANRVRALELMQLLGPQPSRELLLRLAADKEAAVRGKTADVLALQGSADTRGVLVGMLADDDGAVRRKAAEALLRARQTVPLDRLAPMLQSADRFEAWAARRLLERLPAAQWRETALRHEDHRVFLQASLALMLSSPDKSSAQAILRSIQERLEGYLSDRDFQDMLRLSQICLIQGELQPAEVEAFRQRLALEYPAQDDLMNRELVRTLAYLQAEEALPAMMEFLASEAAPMERLHVALSLRYLQSGWTPEMLQRLAEGYRELADAEDVGGSYAAYLRNVSRDFAKSLPPELAVELLAEGDVWPEMTLGALYQLPEQLDETALARLIQLDQSLRESTDESAAALRVGVVAILARSQQASGLRYLQQQWEEDPDRRATIALGLAQYPQGEANWSYLVRSIPILEGPAGQEVVTRLREVEKAPVEDEHIRQTILLGLRLQDKGAEEVGRLLAYWTGEQPGPTSGDWRAIMNGWQSWWAEQHPEKPVAALPTPEAGTTWEAEELRDFLATAEGQAGDVARGREVFVRAQCAKCHRFEQQGEAMGPDLTTIANRFSTREILESILFPSQVISDQYAARNVITVDGRSYSGLLAPGGQNEMVLLQSNGQKVTLAKDDIEESVVSRQSAMPSGLLDQLTLQDIADLFAYLGGKRKDGDVARRPAPPEPANPSRRR